MYKKILCLFLIIACLLTSCGKDVENKEQQPSSSEQTQVTNTKYGLWVDGVWYDCNPVITASNYEMDMAMYRYYFFKAKAEFEKDYSNTIWGDKQANEDLKEYVLSSYLNIMAYCEIAKQNDIKLSQEEQESVNNIINAVKVKYNGEESFEEALKTQYLDEETYRKVLELELLQQKVVGQLYGEDIIKTVDETFVYVQQIFIDATVEHAKEKIDFVLEELNNGEDFEDLMLEYSSEELGGQTGYIYSKGMMHQDLEKEAFSLEKGEYSGVIHSEPYGYYIIKRLEIEEDYIWANITNLVSDTMFNKISADLDAVIQNFEISTNKNYTKISVDTLF